jgi:hypothetical protein
MKTQLLLMALKISTVISYSLIFMEGEHLGGPLIIFLLLGIFFDRDVITNIVAILDILLLAYFVYSSFVPKRKMDMLVFSSGILILILPIIQEQLYLMKNSNFTDGKVFIITSSFFLVTFFITIMFTFKIR